MTTFGERLGDALSLARMTQRELARKVAERSGVAFTEAALSKWATRGLPESIERLRHVCEILGASADDLLDLPTKPPLSRAEQKELGRRLVDALQLYAPDATASRALDVFAADAFGQAAAEDEDLQRQVSPR